MYYKATFYRNGQHNVLINESLSDLCDELISLSIDPRNVTFSQATEEDVKIYTRSDAE